MKATVKMTKNVGNGGATCLELSSNISGKKLQKIKEAKKAEFQQAKELILSGSENSVLIYEAGSDNCSDDVEGDRFKR